MKDLQKLGGLAALASAATYLFAIGLYLTLMAPAGDPNLALGDYVAFMGSHRLLNLVWTASMYLFHGACLVVLILALHERLAPACPRLSPVAALLGLIWTAFVFLSGLLNLVGTESLLALYAKSPAQAEGFRTTLSLLTLGIDSSDKVLGSLWVGLVGLGALKSRVLPRAASLLGMATGVLALGLALVLPFNDTTASFVFALGAMAWWIFLGFILGSKARS